MTYKCIILNIIIEETPFFSVSVLFVSNSYSDFMLCYSQLMHQSSILCPLVCFHGCLIIKFRGRDSLNYAHKDKCSPVCISSMQSPNAVLHLNKCQNHTLFINLVNQPHPQKTSKTVALLHGQWRSAWMIWQFTWLRK